MRTYPFNLIDDLMREEDFHSELSDDEVAQEVEKLLLGLADHYTVNKHIPKRMQTVIYLRYVEGLTYKRIIRK